MADLKEIQELADNVLAAAAKRRNQSPEGPKGSPREEVLADDTLGRLLKRMAPYGRRYARIFGTIGLVCLPIRVFTLCYAAPSLLETAAWAAHHDPLWMPKFIGGVAALALLWLNVVVLIEMEVRNWRLKRASKRGKAGA